MSFVPPSLRAQRSNPDFSAATGLPRRCAPRNDDLLRVFAPLRETKFFLFSRQDAKPQRKRSICGPGSNIVECAADVLRLRGHNMPPMEAEEPMRVAAA
jgi:hypothetical protein